MSGEGGAALSGDVFEAGLPPPMEEPNAPPKLANSRKFVLIEPILARAIFRK